MPEILNYLIVGAAACFAAGLTMYSGFGLGTLMLPVFALFFPVELAVVATALVHGANNVFKVSLLGRHADREVVLKFGLPAIAAAVLGGVLLVGVAAAVALTAAAMKGDRDRCLAALALARAELPDVMILDINMPGGGLETAGRIAVACPATRIVMLTVSEDEDDLLAAMKAGASGYVLKGAGASELAGVIRSVHAGEVYVAPALAEDEYIAFNAGSHTELVRLAYKDFERLVKPKVVAISSAD